MIIPYKRILGATLILGMANLAQADIYKWKDAQGETHYGNTMPPGAAGLATTEIDKNGLVLKQTDAAPTEKQRLNDAAEQARAAKEKQAQIEQQRHDMALLNTYTTPAEIDLARDRNLVQAKLIIDGTNSRLAPLLAKQTALIKESGGKVPDSGPLATSYQENVKHIAQLNDIITNKNKEIETIRSKFAADKARYIELTGNSNKP